MPLINLYNPAIVVKHLNGVINIFKPSGVKCDRVRTAILHNICTALNELNLNKYINNEHKLLKSGGPEDPIVDKLENLNLAEHVLACGPRYEIQDFRSCYAAGLGKHTSGVLCINNGIKQAMRLQKNRPIRAYHVSGRLGKATENHFEDSLVTLRAKYDHVHSDRLGALLSSMQASHQRKMYELCGVDLQSQAAYEIACKGLIRPASNLQTIIYGLKLISFQRPNFTLEVHAINETEDYLATLVHEIGIELRSVAYCTAIRCIRHAQFTLDTALLRHNWHLANVLENIQQQKKVFQMYPRLTKHQEIELRSD